MTYKATEHNIDLYPAFMRLYQITGEKKWEERALHAKKFVDAMWNEEGKPFWTGTLDDGVTINNSNIPLDIQAWAVLALPSEEKYRDALTWAENNCYVDTNEFKGFDFNNDLDGIWFEGVGQMALGYLINQETDKADFYLSELKKVQVSALNNNGKGIVAASYDGLTTGFNWEYFNRLHIGPTAWFIFAAKEKGYNPYWNKFINTEDSSSDYIIISKSNEGGSISPFGETIINQGGDQTFNINPDISIVSP